ncbi:MAG: PAS domain S-box protein [Phenylobacterium sp.]|uniref:sensor histidine kinase n=1 Tax=Phenylobacterium sp. TaxID=1871053 RepID=UPI0025CF87E5|nr:PAS domain-containing protein [Phenylobacterium sp.]MBA4012370.1 PAS domain S-box protein [Phenylobacterium sp.]
MKQDKDEQHSVWRHESQARLRAFIDCAPRKMWISRTDGTIEFLNREWRAYTGVDDVERASWRGIIHPQDLPQVEAVRTRAFAVGEPYEVEARLRQASDGMYRWHRSNVAPVVLGGRIVAWIGTSTDIDDQIRAETSLRESEAIFRTMANTMPQVAWSLDPRSGRYWYNQRWLDLTGKTAEQMEADGWWAAVHPEEADRVREEVIRLKARGEPWEQTCQLRNSDGEYAWFLLRGVPVRDEKSNAITRWFATGTDINEERRLQERQQLLTQEISHRVKNSLAIVASLLALQARDAKDEETSRVLQDAYLRVQTVADVHDHLWRASDAEATDICAFLSELCQKLAEHTPGHEVIFNGELVQLPTDQAVPIGLLVNELVTNAVKYAYPEGEVGPVAVSLSISNGDLRLEVVDHGVGLPANFDLTAKSASLGMRLVANTVRQLGGTVSTADAGPGACFRIQIPCPATQSHAA